MKKIYLHVLISVLSCNLFSQSLPSYVPTNGLVGWWPFNGNANDESGNGNNGTVYGATLTTDRFGNTGKAYSFDGGANTKIEVSLLNPITGNKTYNVWFKVPISFINPYAQLITCNNSLHDYLSLNGNEPTYVSNNTVGKYYDGKSGLLSNKHLNDNQWHNIIIIHNYTNQNSVLYVDGVYNGSLNSTNFNNNPLITLIVIGSTIANNTLSSNHTVFGQLDDIGIWNRALTQAEITALYTSNGVGIQDQSQNQISIYPNPAKTQITITSKSELTGKFIKVYDALGKVVYENVIKPNQLTLNIATWANGIYTIAIPEQGLTYKFVKE